MINMYRVIVKAIPENFSGQICLEGGNAVPYEEDIDAVGDAKNIYGFLLTHLPDPTFNELKRMMERYPK